MFGSYFIQKEDQVYNIFYNFIDARLSVGLDTIVDTLNLEENRINKLVSIAKKYNQEYLIFSFKKKIKDNIDCHYRRRQKQFLKNKTDNEIKKLANRQAEILKRIIYFSNTEYSENHYSFQINGLDSLSFPYEKYQELIKGNL